MDGEPEGQMVDGAYLHEGSNKSRAIIFLTDIFGLPLVNCKIMADKMSKELDCDVWVPDMFNGALYSAFLAFRHWAQYACR